MVICYMRKQSDDYIWLQLLTRLLNCNQSAVSQSNNHSAYEEINHSLQERHQGEIEASVFRTNLVPLRLAVWYGLYNNEAVEKMGRNHVRHKWSVLLLEYNSHNVISYVAFSLQLEAEEMTDTRF